ncbi:hypothetical protein H5411_05045 [Amycolatopsis echigonensis]|uniref:Recombinase n=1 Tax=Amycolatopsis echigonensis TaxID=2576905 RepID=A0A8E1VUF0_9PSEU|nr:hypothetical protein [Amycolatopsis echigonensis]
MNEWGVAQRAWSQRTVLEIVRDPRYTGRELCGRVSGRAFASSFLSERRFLGTQAEWIGGSASDDTRWTNGRAKYRYRHGCTWAGPGPARARKACPCGKTNFTAPRLPATRPAGVGVEADERRMAGRAGRRAPAFTGDAMTVL